MTRPKAGRSASGSLLHYSVGAVIERDGKYLLIDRKKPPFGFAGIAGHIDEGEEPLQALEREVFEEAGLRLESSALLFEEEVPWNECSRGVRGHHWSVYRCGVVGAVKIETSEVKSSGWYTPAEMRELILEPVWKYWFQRLKVL